MKKVLPLLAAGTIVSGICAYTATGQTAAPAKVSITRLACGAGKAPRDIAGFSDTHAYDGVKKAMVASCYLIRHGDEYMLWDAGYPAAIKTDPASPLAMPATILDQLATLGVDPARVGRVGVSHYHMDHIGQARDFPAATLLIGAGDWAALTATDRAPGVDPAPLAHWVSGGGKVEAVRGDKDVFGDGSLVMLNTPGHTPGHHSLLVRLTSKRNVLLTGDVTHLATNYATDGVPVFNVNRADTLASLDRFKKIAATLKATVVIGHETADIAKLPAFPRAAE